MCFLNFSVKTDIVLKEKWQQIYDLNVYIDYEKKKSFPIANEKTNRKYNEKYKELVDWKI